MVASLPSNSVAAPSIPDVVVVTRRLLLLLAVAVLPALPELGSVSAAPTCTGAEVSSALREPKAPATVSDCPMPAAPSLWEGIHTGACEASPDSGDCCTRLPTNGASFWRRSGRLWMRKNQVSRLLGSPEARPGGDPVSRDRVPELVPRVLLRAMSMLSASARPR